MKIRLYIDEDAMDEDLIYALRVRGIDVVTALEAGMIERSDREHLDYASAQGRVSVSMLVIIISFMRSIRLKAGPTQG